MSITQKQADAAIAAATEVAVKMGVPMNIAVLDAAAHLKAFIRMDGSLLGSIDVAIGKAKTAALFGMATEILGEVSKGGALRGLENSNGGLMFFGGGLPILAEDGSLIGAIGVSGGSAAEDAEAGQAGAAAALSVET